MQDFDFNVIEKSKLVKKNGRPKKDNKVDNWIRVNFTDNQIKKINDKYNNQEDYNSLSSYLRNIILKNM